MLQTGMSAMENRDHRTEREAEDAALEKWILWAVVLLIGVGMLISLGQFVYDHFLMRGCGPTRHQYAIHQITTALSQFHTEYRPLRTEEDLTTTTDATFMRPLLGLDDTLNPRRIKFLDFHVAQKGSPGLTGDPPAFVEAWGEPHYVILDSNGDGKIANPEAGADPRAYPILRARTTLIYSSGPDRDPKTWKDNITTWR